MGTTDQRGVYHVQGTLSWRVLAAFWCSYVCVLLLHCSWNILIGCLPMMSAGPIWLWVREEGAKPHIFTHTYTQYTHTHSYTRIHMPYTTHTHTHTHTGESSFDLHQQFEQHPLPISTYSLKGKLPRSPSSLSLELSPSPLIPGDNIPQEVVVEMNGAQHGFIRMWSTHSL